MEDGVAPLQPGTPLPTATISSLLFNVFQFKLKQLSEALVSQGRMYLKA